VQEGEDGSEQAVDAEAGVGQLVGAVGDLADDDAEHGVDVEVGNDGQDEVDDGGGDADDEVEAGLELDANDGEDFWGFLLVSVHVDCSRRATHRP
jgi:hypothetical protein